MFGFREERVSSLSYYVRRDIGFALDIFFVSSLNSVERHLMDPLGHWDDLLLNR